MSIFLSIALKSTLALALAALAVRMLRDAPASLRHSVWAVTFAVLLALPVLDALGPVWAVGVLPGDGASGESLAAPLAPPVGLPLVSQEMLSPAASPSPSVSGAGLGPWLVGLWALGALGVALVWIRAMVLARRLVGDASMVDGPGWADLTARAACRSGLTQPVRLVQSGRLSVPVAWGFGRHAVVLPPQADAWDEERRESVLLHEMAHLRRRDAWTQAVAQAALALHWPNPLAWLAYRRFLEAREQACDDAVLQRGTAPTSYASHLVAIARERSPSRLALAAVAPMAGRDELETRVRSILDGRRRRGQVSRWALGATVGLAVAVGGPLAAFQPVPAEPSAERAARARPAERPPARLDPPETESGRGVVEPTADGRPLPPAMPSASTETPRPVGLRADLAPRDTVVRRPTGAQPSARSGTRSAAPDPAHDAVHDALDADIQAELLAEMGAEVEATRFARRYAARYAEQYRDRYLATVRQSAGGEPLGARIHGAIDIGERPAPLGEVSSRPFPNPDPRPNPNPNPRPNPNPDPRPNPNPQSPPIQRR